MSLKSACVKRAFAKRLLIVLLLLTVTASVFSQERMSPYSQRLQNGTWYYSQARWHEAAAEFRYAQEIAKTLNDWTQALYWVILTELALADYGSALRDMDELDKYSSNSAYSKEMVYHRARAYYNQGYFEDAMALFMRYSEGIHVDDAENADRRAAAFFWIGECLFSIGQFDDAEKFYAWIVARHPGSPKFEVSSYRIDLIKQKKIEAELLALLRWSHEESLRTSEDYQRKLKTYEHTLNSYQRRIAELTQNPSMAQERPQVQEPPRVQEPPPRIQEPPKVQEPPREPPKESVLIPPPVETSETISQQEVLDVPVETVPEFIPEPASFAERNTSVSRGEPAQGEFVNSGAAVKKEITIPANNIPIESDETPNSNEDLIEKARQLGNSLQQILRSYENGGAR